jgi:solute carrier family 25 uncoupling protein 27
MNESHGHQQPKTHTKILLTSLSAMVAETATFPIDLTKTRLQLHSSTTKPTNAFVVASEIIRQQGPLGFYQGLSPAILRHLFYTPIRIVGYENLRYLVVVNNEVAGGGGDLVSLSTKALLGGLSGVIAQVRTKTSLLCQVSFLSFPFLLFFFFKGVPLKV